MNGKISLSFVSVLIALALTAGPVLADGITNPPEGALEMTLFSDASMSISASNAPADPMENLSAKSVGFQTGSGLSFASTAFDPSQKGLSGGQIVGCVVGPVPVPPALILLGSGLVGLVGLRKRFRR